MTTLGCLRTPWAPRSSLSLLSGMATTGELGLGAQHLLAAASSRFGALSGGGSPLARARSQAFLARWRSRLAVTLTRELFAA